MCSSAVTRNFFQRTTLLKPIILMGKQNNTITIVHCRQFNVGTKQPRSRRYSNKRIKGIFAVSSVKRARCTYLEDNYYSDKFDGAFPGRARTHVKSYFRNASDWRRKDRAIYNNNMVVVMFRFRTRMRA